MNGEERARIEREGLEREPVLVIEGAVKDPGGLAACAREQAEFASPSKGENFYPGLLAPAPLGYVESVVRRLDPLIRDTFGLEHVSLGRATCNFALATLSPKALNLAQRLPHVDTVDGLQFAILHYLCGPGFGGTDFYRHRSTGFETLSSDRLDRYQRVLAAETSAHPPQAGYPDGDTPLFLRTGGVDALYNRLIVYRSCRFHSGRIAPGAMLSPDPATGRLTANIFLTYRPIA